METNLVILATGTRHNLPIEQATTVKNTISDYIEQVNPQELIILHGDCQTGVDALVAKWFHPCWAFPAEWERLGKSAGPVRNKHMVETASRFKHYGHQVVCLAFPTEDSTGTIDCMYRAEKAGIEVMETQLVLAEPSTNVVESSLWSRPSR